MATAQIVVIGDVHLRQDARNAQRLASWDRIIAEALELPRLGAWVLCGDLFDAKSTIPDRNEAAARLQRMASHAPVVLLQGNHDVAGDLDVFGRLAARHDIVVCATPTTETIELACGGRLTLALLPYPHKALLTAMGIPPADVATVAGEALLDICRGLAAELAEARADGHATMFAGHVNVSGAVTSTGQPLMGHEISIGAAHLDVFGAIPKVLGHIHRAQDVAGGGIYAGSIARQSWGEVEAKRFLVVAVGPGDGQFDVFSRDIPCPPLYHVEGTLTREGFMWEATRGPGGETLMPFKGSWEGAEVRVRYRFQQSEKSALDVDLVRAPFASADRLELEPIAVPDRALRAPEVAAARTLPEKVEAWARHVGVHTTDTVLAKLQRLEQADPQALVAEVEAWVRELETLEETAVVA